MRQESPWSRGTLQPSHKALHTVICGNIHVSTYGKNVLFESRSRFANSSNFVAAACQICFWRFVPCPDWCMRMEETASCTIKIPKAWRGRMINYKIYHGCATISPLQWLHMQHPSGVPLLLWTFGCVHCLWWSNIAMEDPPIINEGFPGLFYKIWWYYVIFQLSRLDCRSVIRKYLRYGSIVRNEKSTSLEMSLGHESFERWPSNVT